MGFILDAIRKKIVLDNAESVSLDWTSSKFSLDDREDEFSVQVNYENGNSPDMVFVLQFSVDGVNFADVEGFEQIVSDESGMHIWDVAGTGANYARVIVKVNSGSIDVTRIYYSGKQRH